MSRSLRARWTNGIALFGIGALMAWTSAGQSPLWSVVAPLLWAAAGLWASPIGDRTTHTQRQVEALPPDRRRVVVYARPGCTWCLRLRLALLGHSPAPLWVDVWDDDDASAFVRAVNEGNETVPTVVIGDVGLVNPSAAHVADLLGRMAPHLLPDEFDEPRSGLIGRLLGS